MVDAHKPWTYEELNQKANRIAHMLLQKNGDIHRPVGIMMKQDAVMIATILGCLKAGRIYTVLQPSLPPSVIRNILTDAKIEWLITTEQEYELAASAADDLCDIFRIDALHHAKDTNPELEQRSDSDCVIYFTSARIWQAWGGMARRGGKPDLAKECDEKYRADPEA